MHKSVHLVHDAVHEVIQQFGIHPTDLSEPLRQVDTVKGARLQRLNILQREAARGIVRDKNKVLLMYTERYDDFSLPGGGIDKGEAPTDALRRELLEEAGADDIRIISKFAQVTEYIPTWKQGWDLMFQTSHCFECELYSALVDNQLEHYEVENGMSVQWVDLDDALRHNRSVIDANPASMGISIVRETYLLGLLQQKLQASA